jgi:hypothetical protein
MDMTFELTEKAHAPLVKAVHDAFVPVRHVIVFAPVSGAE